MGASLSRAFQQEQELAGMARSYKRLNPCLVSAKNSYPSRQLAARP